MYRRVSFTSISASWHGALLREQTSLPKASNRFLVSHVHTVVAVPNSTNGHHENVTIATVYNDGNDILTDGIDGPIIYDCTRDYTHALQIPAKSSLNDR